MESGGVKEFPLPQNLDKYRKEQEGGKERDGGIGEYSNDTVL